MHRRIARLSELIASATCGLTPETLGARRAGKWSIAEILEHLALTYTGTTRGMSRVLEAGRPLSTGMSAYQRIGTFMIACGHMPQGRKAPAHTVPKGIDAANIVEFTRAALQEMDERLTAVESRFGRAKVLDHPVLGAWTVPMWRQFHFVHGRHHVRQIERLKA